MARNKEKHVVGLNRIWLQTLDEEFAKKNPPRPGLGSLNTSAEVKKWIPSIKKDIDFCLKQSQVTCYTDSHVQDFSTRIEALTREYKAYVRKLRQLEPQTDAVPWTDRPYKRKHGCKDAGDQSVDDAPDKSEVIKPDFAAIRAPILDSDDTYSELYGYNDRTEDDTCSDPPVSINSEIEDKPLVFVNKTHLSIEAGQSGRLNLVDKDTKYSASSDKLCCIQSDKQTRSNSNPNFEVCSTIRDKIVNSDKNVENRMTQSNDMNCHLKTCSSDSTNNQSPNVTLSRCSSTSQEPNNTKSSAGDNMKLYIPYSDSSSDEEEKV